MDATGMHRRGAFVDPTVFDNVDPSMRVAREAIFGPVLGVIPVNRVDEALARDTDDGLHATLFTRDIDKAFHLAKRLPCGTVAINGFSEGNVTTPFGGYKPSGSTARDNGTEAMDRYLQTKTIWLSLR
ncbi:aldehyde dehydrogenase family protein [Ancylobacter vacuolatus]|uniref:Acyl-CoA reductase-like NAD-dependent aldehyde dehydrogenase n=1 Tax=Ancylobacter vacuolatus TaxID=223389 RepID=A0ABU0DNQ6_9HYPH|nr:aldehyde dehydrogenase family protein [Ancylobacter vacuolatus]MDQ0350015.1 acyl-CoA reductase-like NAD-dependent aldehyde dehydrogenase [Ancylobacter vacuolatus]